MAPTWNSNGKWIFKNDGTIENTTKKRLSITADDTTIEEIPAPDNTKQIWKKGDVNKEGYFTLMNESSEKYLTAVSTNAFETCGTKNQKK
jgi:hypothetical protein